jgi:hypothetical protein
MDSLSDQLILWQVYQCRKDTFYNYPVSYHLAKRFVFQPVWNSVGQSLIDSVETELEINLTGSVKPFSYPVLEFV